MDRSGRTRRRSSHPVRGASSTLLGLGLLLVGGSAPAAAQSSSEPAVRERVTGQIHRTVRRAGPGPLPRAAHGVRLGTTTAGIRGSGFRLGSPAAPRAGAFGTPAGARPGFSSRGGGILHGLPRHLVHGPLVPGGHAVRGAPGGLRIELADRTIVLAPFRAFVFDAAGNRRVFLLGPTLWPFGFLPWVVSLEAAGFATTSFEVGDAGAVISAGGDGDGGTAGRRRRGAPYRPPLPDPGPPLPAAAGAPPGACAEATVRMVAGAERRLRIATGPLGAATLAQAEEILAARSRRGEPLVLRGWDGSGFIAPGSLAREVSLAPCAEAPGGG